MFLMFLFLATAFVWANCRIRERNSIVNLGVLLMVQNSG